MRSGENNTNWKGGRKYKRGASGGHILAYAPNHPMARKRFVAEHRLIMERKVGRILTTEERVHHIDCDPQNNRISNLDLCPNNVEHNLAHGSLNMCVKELLARGHLKYNKRTHRYFLP
jgi:hypothetical protein